MMNLRRAVVRPHSTETTTGGSNPFNRYQELERLNHFLGESPRLSLFHSLVATIGTSYGSTEGLNNMRFESFQFKPGTYIQSCSDLYTVVM